MFSFHPQHPLPKKRKKNSEKAQKPKKDEPQKLQQDCLPSWTTSMRKKANEHLPTKLWFTYWLSHLVKGTWQQVANRHSFCTSRKSKTRIKLSAKRAWTSWYVKKDSTTAPYKSLQCELWPSHYCINHYNLFLEALHFRCYCISH